MNEQFKEELKALILELQEDFPGIPIAISIPMEAFEGTPEEPPIPPVEEGFPQNPYIGASWEELPSTSGIWPSDSWVFVVDVRNQNNNAPLWETPERESSRYVAHNEELVVGGPDGWYKENEGTPEYRRFARVIGNNGMLTNDTRYSGDYWILTNPKEHGFIKERKV